MKFIKFLFLLLSIMLNEALHAQSAADTTSQLQEVVIEGNRLNTFTTGNKIQKIDSATIQRFKSGNLGDLLTFNSHLFIKSYGIGNLASISSRGTNASQTAVLWNGFNVQSPTLGQADFSYFPVSFADDIEIQYGGAGALFGSGATGGIINFNSVPRFNNGLTFGASLNGGSFNSWQQSANVSLSQKKFVSVLKVFNFSAENDFPFYVDDLKVRQINATVKQKGLMSENFFRIKKDQQLNVRIWLQDNYREIPPSIASRSGNQPMLFVNETLESDFLRLSSEWKKSGKVVSYFVRTAYFNDGMSYIDTLANMHAVTRFHTSISEAESILRLGRNHLLNVGLNNTFNQASSNGYPDAPSQNRTALFGSYKFSFLNDHWRTVVSLRQEMIGGKLIPLTPSAGVEGRLVKFLSVKANVSRTYKVPTFNDLYWNPGGNKNLKPESGWSEEVSVIASQYTGNRNKNSVMLTFFNSNVENCIMWLPAGGTWSAQNIQSVWSRGLESIVSINKEIRDFKVGLTVLYNYVVATNQKARMANDNIVGKQLIYVPVYSAQATMEVVYKGFYLNYIHNYTGNRFYTTDNSKVVEGYHLGNVIAGRNFKVGNSFLNVHVRVNNLWNQSYQVVLNQAMPLRYIQAGLSYMFNKPNKSIK
ncbi:MAG: TonB-dependent receptor [Sporocytophaga sp.]|nr:TonB-dependent receptor [Sporocytophaga sp.]